MAFSSYWPGGRFFGSANRKGTRSCSPVGTFKCRERGRAEAGTPKDQVHSQLTFCRELLTTTSCFSTVSPGKKLWSLLVKCSGFPAKYAKSGRLFRSKACAAGVGIQSERSKARSIRSY